MHLRKRDVGEIRDEFLRRHPLPQHVAHNGPNGELRADDDRASAAKAFPNRNVWMSYLQSRF